MVRRRVLSRGRTIFRATLAVGLVWAAWPTVAAAVGTSTEVPARTAAAALPITLPPPSTVAVPVAPAPEGPAPIPIPIPTPVTEAPISSPPAGPDTTTPPASPPPPSEAPAPAPVASEPSPVAQAICATDPVIDAINRDRLAAGVGRLCADAGLAALAQAWADQLAAGIPLAHQDLQSAIGHSRFVILGENILAGGGSPSPDAMEAAWMASPKHAENCVRPEFTVAGVGTAFAAGRTYVVVDFGG
jgi:uncharacterized protein YkwD